MIDETGPIQILELFSDGSCRLQIRNHAGRGYRWKSEIGDDVTSLAERFVRLNPHYVPPAVERACKPSWWRQMFAREGK